MQPISAERIASIIAAARQAPTAPPPSPSNLGPGGIAAYIDHTLLKPEATPQAVERLCDEAAMFHFASVCINAGYVRLAAERLHGTPVRVCTVVGFPLGATSVEAKAFETHQALRDGAREIDMAINVGRLKAGQDEYVCQDILAVVEAARQGASLVKVIIEAALLTDDEKVRACHAAREAGAEFVKTSTGFAPGGATVADVRLMRAVVAGTKMGVKAAGGIRSLADALAMIAAGATRIGASAGVQIVSEARGDAAGTQAGPATTTAHKSAGQY